MKRIISAALLLIVCFFLVPAAAAAQTDVVVTLSGGSVSAGESIKVDLSLTASVPVNSIAVFGFSYDTDVLTFTGFSDYEHLDGLTILPPTFDENKGAVIIGLRQAQEFDGKLCSLNFKVSEDAAAGVTSVNANTLTKNGAATVSSAMAPAAITVFTTTSSACAISVEETENGTVTVDKTEAEVGETVTVTATPAEGYRLLGIKVDGTAITGNTFAVTGAHEVTAEFAKLLNFASTSANVGDVLDLNFRVTAAEVDFEGGYAILSGPQGEQRVDRADWKKSGTRYNIPYKGMFATMMADEVTAVVYDDNGNQMVAAQSDSIRGYTMRALNTYGSDPKYAKLCVLLVDMLVYGATAQEKFGHNAADPADSLLSDAQRALATVEAKPYQSIQEKSHTGNSASATLGSRIELNFTFLKSDVEGAASAKFTFNHAQSTLGAAEVIVPAGEFAESGSTKWKIALNALVAADNRQPVRCEILDADGNVLAWSVDTVAGYVARLIGGNASYKWVESMVIFCDSAYGYFCQ